MKRRFLTAEDRQKLRDAALAACDGARGDWELKTSKFLRISANGGDGNVLCATLSDGVHSLHAAPGVLAYMIAAQPRVVLGLLSDLDVAEESAVDKAKSVTLEPAQLAPDVVMTVPVRTEPPDPSPPIRDPRARLEELTSPTSTNFFGTGLTMRELMKLHDAEALARSWELQPRDERRRRLATVTRLCVELARIRETESFGTRLAELAIESVIVGDWKLVEEWAEHFSFADESLEVRERHASSYATFRELLLQALRSGKEGPA